MALQQAAALGAGAACMGAALAVSVAAQGFVQALAVAVEEDDEPEDHTEAEWATNRCRQAAHRACTALGGPEGGSGIARSLMIGVLNLYRVRLNISVTTQVQPYHLA